MANNYTRNITFAKASSMPKYMQLLKAIKTYNDRGIYASRRNLIGEVWHIDFDTVCKSWQNGPFTLLSKNGLATFTKHYDGRVTWHITEKGRAFLAKCEKAYESSNLNSHCSNVNSCNSCNDDYDGDEVVPNWKKTYNTAMDAYKAAMDAYKIAMQNIA